MATPDETDRKNTTFSCGSDEDYSLVCLPCHRDESAIPAFGYCIDCNEHLCHNCYKYHKKATLSRHHKLQDKDTMPSTQRLTDTSVQAVPSVKLSKPCQPSYIPEKGNHMINCLEYADTMYRMKRLLKKCTTVKSKTSKDTDKSNDSLQNAMQDIKKYRQQINKRIDDLQKEIENEIQAVHHQNVEKVKTAKTICDDVMKKVNALYDIMKQHDTSKQANKLFMEQAQTELQGYENSISSISAEYGTAVYKFIVNQTINDVLQKEKMIGDISTDPLSTPTYDNITPTGQGQIRVKSYLEKSTCQITGMTVLSPDRLVLTDYENCSIKLVDVDVNSRYSPSHFSFGEEYQDSPYDVTPTTSTQIAVTLPGRQRIQFISVSYTLRKTDTIQTDGECHGICYYQNKLIVTYWNPGKLEILDMGGRVIKRVKTDSTGNDVFKHPRYVQANGNSIYVSDVGHKEVIMLNWQGEITGRLVCGDLTGLALLSNGSLLVCDHERDRVCHVSGDCTNSKIVLHDVRGPFAVCVDDEGRKLYISRWNDFGHQVNSNMLVYNI